MAEPPAGCFRTSRVALFVLFIAALLGGCGDGDRSWTMFPAPIVVKDPRLDFTRFVAPEHRTTDVQVFYATTRAPAPEGYPERYARKPGDISTQQPPRLIGNMDRHWTLTGSNQTFPRNANK